MSSIARPIITLGMDVHKDSTIATFPDGARVPTRADRLINDLANSAVTDPIEL